MRLPIATAPDLAQVERLRPLVQGQSIVVVGSAPLKTKYADVIPGEPVIAVNGGISSLDPEAWPSAVWVLNSKLQDRPGDPALKPLHKTMLEQGRGRTTGHVLLLRGPEVESESYTLAKLDAMGCRYQSWSVLDKVTKRWFEGQHCGRVSDMRPCSAGILAVTMALVCGAASVRMVGFSLHPGYHYLPDVKPQYWWRDHQEADRMALSTLAKAGYRLSSDLLVVAA